MDCQQEEETKRRGRHGTYGNIGDLPKIRNKSRKLTYGGGDTGLSPPKISLSESNKKDNTDRERVARPQA